MPQNTFSTLSNSFSEQKPAAQAAQLSLAEVILLSPYYTAASNLRRDSTVANAKTAMPEQFANVPHYKAPYSFLNTMLLDAGARFVPRMSLSALNAVADQVLSPEMGAYAAGPAGIAAQIIGMPGTNWAQGKAAFTGARALAASELFYGAGVSLGYGKTRAYFGFDQEKRQYPEAIASGFAGALVCSAFTLVPHGITTSTQLLGDAFNKLDFKKQATLALRSAPLARLATCMGGVTAAAIKEYTRPLLRSNEKTEPQQDARPKVPNHRAFTEQLKEATSTSISPPPPRDRSR